MAVNQHLVDAMNKYHAATSRSPAVDIIKGATIVGSIWMKYREDQRKKTEAALEEYIIDDAPSGIDHWNDEGTKVISDRLADLKRQQDMYIRRGDKAGAIRVFKEADKVMSSVNKLSGIFAQYKVQKDGVDGVKTMFSNASNNDLIDQLVSGDGNYRVFLEPGTNELKIQPFTHDPNTGDAIPGDIIDLDDVADSVFLKANDIAGNITKEIARIAGEDVWAENKGQLNTYLSQSLDDKATLYSIFWDDVLPLSDGGMSGLTLADEYMKENNLTAAQIQEFNPASSTFPKPGTPEYTATLQLMKKFAIEKIMGLSKTFHANNNKPESKVKWFTKDTDLILDDGTEVEVSKDKLNNVLRLIRTPADGNSFEAWDDQTYEYIRKGEGDHEGQENVWYNAELEKYYTDTELAAQLKIEDYIKGTGGSIGVDVGL